MRRNGCRSVALALVCGFGVACTTPLTVEEERQLGVSFEKSIREEIELVRDPEVVGYVRRIGQAILRAAGPQPFDYKFYVVNDEAINAFAGPAGHVYMNTGTLLAAKNVGEIAGVMAHEVGHVARRHIANNYNRQRSAGILTVIGVIGAAALGGEEAAELAATGGGLAAAAYLNTFSRDAERDADAFAVRVMPGAGYDPEGLVSFFETLKAQSGGSPPAFLSSHPATAERIQNTRRMIAEQGRGRGLRRTDGGGLERIQQRLR